MVVPCIEPHRLVEVLDRYTFYTVGCTDPVAIALATSRAAALFDDPPSRVRVLTDKNIFKNSFSVGIPGTERYGLHTAAALGAVVKNKGNALTFLANCTPEDIAAAERLVSEGRVQVEHHPEYQDLYVEAWVETPSGTARAIIRHEHNQLALLEKNGEVLVEREALAPALTDFNVILPLGTELEDLVESVNQLTIDDVAFLLKGLEVNLAAAEAGLATGAGLGIGAKLNRLDERADDPARLIHRARVFSAAATDARMAGLQVPVVGCFGSGTHGAILFNTIGVVGKALNATDLEIGRALALGVAVLGCFKNQSSVLTPHCGSGLDAGAGAAAGVAYLLGADPKQMLHAVNYVVANHYGTVCDGAKPGCAVKIASAAGIAVEGAWLAKEGMTLLPHGIVGETFSDTVANVGYLTRKGLAMLDASIVEILVEKGEAC